MDWIYINGKLKKNPANNFPFAFDLHNNSNRKIKGITEVSPIINHVYLKKLNKYKRVVRNTIQFYRIIFSSYPPYLAVYSYDKFVYHQFRIQYRKNINLSFDVFKRDFTSIILFTKNLFIRIEILFSSSTSSMSVTIFVLNLFTSQFRTEYLPLIIFSYYILHSTEFASKYVELENIK